MQYQPLLADKKEASVLLKRTSTPMAESGEMAYGSDEERVDTAAVEASSGVFLVGIGALDEQQNLHSHEDAIRSRRIRIFVGCLLVLVFILVVIDSFTGRRVEQASLAFLEWVQKHPFLGVLAVVGVFTLATVLFVPGAILTIGTGFAFGSAFDNAVQGVALASTAVFFGACCGSICSFLLGRYLFRDCVMHLASKYPVFQAIDKALQGNGLKIMILLRLSPLIPYNALDYMSGVTSIPLWSYTVALIAMLPGTIMFTFIGATASSFADSTGGSAENKTIRIISLVFGVTFAVLGVLVASYYSKVELNKIIAADNDAAQSSSPPNEEVNESELTGLGHKHHGSPSAGRYHSVV